MQIATSILLKPTAVAKCVPIVIHCKSNEVVISETEHLPGKIKKQLETLQIRNECVVNCDVFWWADGLWKLETQSIVLSGGTQYILQ